MKRRMICSRQAEKKTRHLSQQHFMHGIKLSSEKENLGAEIENALLCSYERVRRELRKINVTLAPQDNLETNFQIIIDSELAKAILKRLSIISSSRNSDEENTTSIVMNVKDSEKDDGKLKEKIDETDAVNKNEMETEAEEENEIKEHSGAVDEDGEEEDGIQPSVDAENELSTIISAEQEEEPSPLPPTETIPEEEGPNGDNSTEKQIDESAEKSLNCNFTAYQEMKLQCKEKDDEKEEGDGLPCSIKGLWVSDVGGVQLDIKDSSSRGYLDVQVHDLTPPKKGFLSASWKIVGQFPFLDMDENIEKSDSLGEIFSLTATIPGASSDTGEKQLAIFIGECHVCEGGLETIVGTWSLKRPSKSCRDALLSLQEIRDVLHKDILSESIRSKSRRMVNLKKNRGHRGRLYRNMFRRSD